MHLHMHKAQEESEIAHLYNTSAQGMLTYVQMHTTSQEDAEDIVVEVFLAALENTNFGTLPEKAKQLWLWRVAHNKIIDTYRRSKFRQSMAIEHVADTKNSFTIRVLTWSPNGNFIVSADSPETSSSTIQVWIAK